MAKWGPLRGEHVEVRQLAAMLRAVADQRGRSVRSLEDAIPYGRTAISLKLSGVRRPEWGFVQDFLEACAGGDLHGLELLVAKVRPM